MDNLEEMDTIQETYNFLRLKENEIDNISTLITSSETEFVLKKKKTPKAKSSPGPDNFTREFYQTYKEKLIPILLKLSKKLKSREHSQIHSLKPPFCKSNTERHYKKEN